MLDQKRIRNDATRVLKAIQWAGDQSDETINQAVADVVELIRINRAYNLRGEVPERIGSEPYDPEAISEEQYGYDTLVNTTAIYMLKSYEASDIPESDDGSSRARRSKSKGGRQSYADEDAETYHLIMRGVTRFGEILLHWASLVVPDVLSKIGQTMVEGAVEVAGRVASAVITNAFSLGISTAVGLYTARADQRINYKPIVQTGIIIVGGVAFSYIPYISFEVETQQNMLAASNTVKTVTGVTRFARNTAAVFSPGTPIPLRGLALYNVMAKVVSQEWIYRRQDFPETQQKLTFFMYEMALNVADMTLTANHAKDLIYAKYGQFLKQRDGGTYTKQVLVVDPKTGKRSLGTVDTIIPPKRQKTVAVPEVVVRDDLPIYGQPAVVVGGAKYQLSNVPGTLSGPPVQPASPKTFTVPDVIVRNFQTIGPIIDPTTLMPMDVRGSKYQHRPSQPVNMDQPGQQAIPPGKHARAIDQLGMPAAFEALYNQLKQPPAQNPDMLVEHLYDKKPPMPVQNLEHLFDKKLPMSVEHLFDKKLPIQNVLAERIYDAEKLPVFTDRPKAYNIEYVFGGGDWYSLLTQHDIPKLTKSFIELGSSMFSAVKGDAERYKVQGNPKPYAIEPPVVQNVPISKPLINVIKEGREAQLQLVHRFTNEIERFLARESKKTKVEPEPDDDDEQKPDDDEQKPDDREIMELMITHMGRFFYRKVKGELAAPFVNIGKIMQPLLRADTYYYFLENVLKPTARATDRFIISPVARAAHYVDDSLHHGQTLEEFDHELDGYDIKPALSKFIFGTIADATDYVDDVFHQGQTLEELDQELDWIDTGFLKSMADLYKWTLTSDKGFSSGDVRGYDHQAKATTVGKGVIGSLIDSGAMDADMSLHSTVKIEDIASLQTVIEGHKPTVPLNAELTKGVNTWIKDKHETTERMFYDEPWAKPLVAHETSERMFYDEPWAKPVVVHETSERMFYDEPWAKPVVVQETSERMFYDEPWAKPFVVQETSERMFYDEPWTVTKPEVATLSNYIPIPRGAESETNQGPEVELKTSTRTETKPTPTPAPTLPQYIPKDEERVVAKDKYRFAVQQPLDDSLEKAIARDKSIKTNLRPFLATAGTDAFSEQTSEASDRLKAKNLMIGQLPQRHIGTAVSNPLQFGLMVQDGVRYSGDLDETPVYYMGGSLTEGDELYGTVRDRMPDVPMSISRTSKIFKS